MNSSNLLERVLALSQFIAESRALEPLLPQAMDQAVALVGGESGYLALFPDEGPIQLGVRYGEASEEVDGVSMSILTKVRSTGTPQLIRNALGDARYSGSRSIMELKIRSVLCVPLIFQGTVLGAIYIENRQITGQFTEEHLAPLTMFANQVAAFIQNARLNDELEARITARTLELRNANVELERSWAQAVEANRGRMDLITVLAHDIRAPLSSVYVAADMLCESDGLADADRKLATTIYTTSGFLAQLTKDVLDLSRLEAGALRVDLQPIDLADFLQRMHGICQALPWALGVDFRLSLDEGLPIVQADILRLQQIVMNLVSNAQKFTESGFVELYAQSIPGGAVVGVRDSGEGIPEDKLESIFERYRQADGNWARRQRGAGLGLAICHDLVDLLGGQIEVRSTVGKGSDFYCVFPQAVPQRSVV